MLTFSIITVLLVIFFFAIFFKNKIDLFFVQNNLYREIDTCINHIVFKVIIIIFAGFNAYILLCLGNEEKANWFKQNFGHVGSFILDNGGIIVFLGIALSGGYGLFLSFIQSKCLDNSVQENFNKLSKQYDITIKVLEQLEKVVIEKRLLLASAAKDYLSTPQTPKHKTVFDRITQPEIQIKLLIESLHDCIKSIYPNEFLKVALVRVKGGQLDDWVCHSPYNTRPRTTINQLRHPDSTFSKVLLIKKMIIVADTQTEIKKQTGSDIMYIQGNTDPSESWCQVCVPVHSINSNEAIFIISIAIKAANVISPENEKFLEWLFKFFISRLALEHSLTEIKERISK